MKKDQGRSLETGTILAVLLAGLALTGLGLSPTVGATLPFLQRAQASLSFTLYVSHMAMAALLVAFAAWHLLPFRYSFSRKPGVALWLLLTGHALLALVAIEVLTGLELYFHVYVPLGKREVVLVHLATTFILLAPLTIHAARGLRLFLRRRAAMRLARDVATAEGRAGDARAARTALGRRAFLRMVAYGVAGVALAAAFARATAGDVRAWRLNFVGPTPKLDKATYKLRVTGLVGKPIELTYAQLRAMPSKTVRFTHRCVEGWTYTDTFTGVPLPDVMRLAGGVRPEATQLMLRSPEVSRQMHSYGKTYTVNLPIRDAARDELYLVYAVGGEDLPVEHGAPIRLMSPVKWGYKACKWLTEIEAIADADALGYWERVGYHKVGDWPGPIFA